MDYIACQAPISLGFPRQEYWSGLPFPSLRDLPDPGIKPEALVSLAWQADSSPLCHLGSPILYPWGSQVANPLATHQESVYMYQSHFLLLKPTVDRVAQVALVVKNLPANAGDVRHGFNSRVGKISWRKAWQPTPVFLSGGSHGQRNLADYNPYSRTELDMTEVT